MSDTKRILILEDDPDLIEALEEEFRAAGYETMGVRDGSVALEVAAKFQPEGLILDLLLPRMEGLKVLEKLRQKDWGKELPVIVLTNFDEPNYITQAQALDARHFFVKANHPLSDLIQAMNQLLGIEEPQPTQV